MMPILSRSTVVGCLMTLPLFSWVNLFAQVAAPPTPPAPNTVSIEIGPTLAGVLVMVALQLVAAFTAYLAYRRSITVERKLEEVQGEQQTVKSEQKNANLETHKVLGTILTDVNSKSEKMERELSDTKAQVSMLSKLLATGHAQPAAPQLRPADVKEMKVDADHVTVVPAKPDDAQGG